MKKRSFILSLLVVLLTFVTSINIFLSQPKKVSAYSSDWDYINSIVIDVETNKDGTLNMNYNISWTVLRDDYGSSPLKDVYIGVPNKYVSDLKASNNVSKIKYSDKNGNSDGGAFIHVEFSRSYYKDEVANFSFSFLQSRFFTYDEQNDEISYEFFTPYFGEILIGHAEVNWKKGPTLAIASSLIVDNGDYYTWSKDNLSYNKYIDVDIAFEKAYFTTIDLKKSYSSAYNDPTDEIIIGVIFAAIALLIILAVWQSKVRAQNSFGYYRGFSGSSYMRHYHHNHYYHVNHGGGYTSNGSRVQPSRPSPSSVNSHSSSSSHHSSGGHSCACACACACAGGGRAGCSRKDFVYNEKDTSSRIIEIIEKNN